MEGIQARLTARLGPLPVWAWAALALALILGFMWWKKIGFFAPATDQPSASGSGPAASSTDLPVGVGGLAGAGTLASPTDPQPYVPVPSAGYSTNYASVDPGSGSVVSQPSTDLSSGLSPTGFAPTSQQVAVSSLGSIPILGSILNRAAGTAPFAGPSFSGVPGRAGTGSTQF